MTNKVITMRHPVVRVRLGSDWGDWLNKNMAKRKRLTTAPARSVAT